MPWSEKRDSPEVGKDTIVREYSASALNFASDEAAYIYALNSTPMIQTHPVTGTLYRQTVDMSPQGGGIYYFRVPYGKTKKESGNYTLSFDTTGGTLHITQAKESIAKYPDVAATPPSHGVIGVHEEEIDGTDIIIPALKMSVDFEHPMGIITAARIKDLARWTGRTNSTPFFGFDPGEVLFLGATGSEGTDQPTSAQYQFAMSENLANQVIGGIAVSSKKGWEIAHMTYVSDVEDDRPIMRVEFVYVERVYDTFDMAAALGFGG